MEIDWHNRAVDRCIKVKKGDVLISGLVLKCLPFLSSRVMVDFVVKPRSNGA